MIQVMPATGQGIARERGIEGHTASRLFDPEYAVDFGAYYIAQQLRAFGLADDPDWQQSVERAAGAYNGGPGAAQRALAGGEWPEETQRYRRWVGGMWRERHQATSATFDQWMNAGGRVLVAKAGG